MKRIFLDNAATTPMDGEVLEAMLPYLSGFSGNPSSVHAWGRDARRAIEDARLKVANAIGADAKNVVFTSGATEANHQALVGHFLALPPSRRHLVVSAIEHHSVLDTCAWLTQFGGRVTYIRPDQDGRVSPTDVAQAVTAETGLVAVMLVNNELGTIQPVADITQAVRSVNDSVRIHSDMVQALGCMSLRLAEMDIDSAAFSAHKIHGPQGVGALYLRNGIGWQKTLHGGSQEMNRRAGTENVAGIVGFGRAVTRLGDPEERAVRIALCCERLWRGLSRLPGIRRNTPTHSTAPGILNIAFKGITNVRLLTRLDLEGIAASAGSACTAGDVQPSHVLIACGQPERDVREAIRLSISEGTTVEEIDAAVATIGRIVLEWLNGE